MVQLTSYTYWINTD